MLLPDLIPLLLQSRILSTGGTYHQVVLSCAHACILFRYRRGSKGHSRTLVQAAQVCNRRVRHSHHPRAMLSSTAAAAAPNLSCPDRQVFPCRFHLPVCCPPSLSTYLLVECPHFLGSKVVLSTPTPVPPAIHRLLRPRSLSALSILQLSLAIIMGNAIVS
jgi:hypothetical protein